jgi:hypothetical protein
MQAVINIEQHIILIDLPIDTYLYQHRNIRIEHPTIESICAS